MEPNLILSKIKNGCRSSFQQIFNLYYAELVFYANKFFYDKSLSEDIVQEVFINIWEASDRIKINSSFKAYLYSMVKNRALNELKKIKITDDLNALNDLSNIEVEYEFLEVIEPNRYEEVQNIISQMPQKMRLIFELKYLSGYSSAEISAELKVSDNTVKTQLYRAKNKIVHSFHIFILFFLFL